MPSRHMKRAEKRERDRQRKWRNSAQGRFEASFAHIDYSSVGDSRSWLSDGGDGVERIVSHCDGEECRSARRLKRARRLIRRLHPEWLEVFDLIVKNGSNRRESIWQMASKKTLAGLRRRCDTGTT